VKETPRSTAQLLDRVKERFNMLIPVMLEMGIVEDLLNKKVVLAEEGGPAYTVSITSAGMTVSEGDDPFCHARLATTRDQWEKILTGKKTYATIFRFELDPVRAVVPLKDMSLVERFSSVMQAMVLLPLG
jgi:hypothetical protein